jgi:hypothetical protein
VVWTRKQFGNSSDFDSTMVVFRMTARLNLGNGQVCDGCGAAIGFMTSAFRSGMTRD